MSVTMKLDFDAASSFVSAKAAAVLADLAEDVKANVQALTPVDTGRLKASIEITPATDRIGLNIGSTVPYAVHQEFGTSKIAARAMFRRGIAKTAGRFASIAAMAVAQQSSRSPWYSNMFGKVKSSIGRLFGR